MTVYTQPMCMVCARLLRTNEKFSCEAFRDGIPDAILESRFDHRKHFSGDDGKMFVQDREQMSVADIVAGITFTQDTSPSISTVA